MAEPRKKPDTAKSRRRSKWPKATLEAEVKALREEISSLQGRVSELEAASHDKATARITPPANFDKAVFMELAGSVPKESFDPEHWQLD